MTSEGKLRFVRDQIVLPHGRTVGQELETGRDLWIEHEVLGRPFLVAGRSSSPTTPRASWV